MKLFYWLLTLSPSWAIPLKGPDGEIIIARQGDYWMGRFPGYKRTKL